MQKQLFESTSKAASFKNGVVTVPAGSSSFQMISTKRSYRRPLTLEVDIRATPGKSASRRLLAEMGECTVALFASKPSKHKGYNAGIGWWSKYFGAGVDRAVKRAGGSPNLNEWQQLKIDAREDGWVSSF